MKTLTRSRLLGPGQHRSRAMALGGMCFLVWGLGGCDETIVAAAPTALVETTAVEANDDCPSGGQAITTGVDQNGNGVLDESEITQRSLVCNGANGEASPCAVTEGDAGVTVACPGSEPVLVANGRHGDDGQPGLCVALSHRRRPSCVQALRSRRVHTTAHLW